MKLEQQLKLQSFLDGELPEGERRALASVLERDAQARALVEELRGTRTVLVSHEPAVAVPETREFYWSKIARAIEREERQAVSSRSAGQFFAWLRRMAAPVAGLAVVALALIVMFPRQAGLPAMETTLPDAGSVTYRDHANGVTLVWLSYPADTEVDYEAPPLGSNQ